MSLLATPYAPTPPQDVMIQTPFRCSCRAFHRESSSTLPQLSIAGTIIIRFSPWRERSGTERQSPIGRRLSSWDGTVNPKTVRQGMDQKELIKIIEKAAREGAKNLELRGEGITQLPKQIGQLIHLQHLDLSNNQLATLPEQIGELTNLRRLNLLHNELSTIPKQIGQLTKLKYLWVANNHLKMLPRQIEELSNLD